MSGPQRVGDQPAVKQADGTAADGTMASTTDRTVLPQHVAIIMDGNGRWARSRNLPRIEGHRRGVSTVRMTSETCSELGIGAVTLYCLSSENWKRPRSELDFLMQLLEQYLVEERRLLLDQNMRLRMIGRRDRLTPGVLTEMDRTLAMLDSNTGTELVLAVDYGGRDELVRATRRLAEEVREGKRSVSDIDEDSLNAALDTAGLPEVDLVIRTGGDMRVSNFLLWQLSYAELWVCQQCWPEFSKSDLLSAIREFATRPRRFGGLEPSEISETD